ncbi:MAG: 4,5-DOPA dioxygenase extradiol, partial [Burkholderiaceae bacterium]|nr:4,5-DOPA dioxygenase extradiol [Burkholderiaceae bacterium]
MTTALAAVDFQSLKKSPRMPVMFLGHGSPMNAIEDNAYRRSWQTLGQDFGVRFPRPQLILCVSAHWLTRGWHLTAMAQPRTIHDFGGFPQALFDQQYPAPGAPGPAREIAQSARQPGSGAPLGLDQDEWGFDHGTWSVLKPMFPKADIPVVQLSMDYSRPPSQHYALGRQLKDLRERGVLIVGSGNIVHNLRMVRRGPGASAVYDWATEFDQTIGRQIEGGQLDTLQNFQSLGRVAQLAHPTHEHYLPMLYAAGAVDAGEAHSFFNTSHQLGSISMRS